MKQANIEIRNKIQAAGLTQWQVAEEIGINATTLNVWLRTPLNNERKQRVDKAIEELKGELQSA